MLKRASLGALSVGRIFWNQESIHKEDVEPCKDKAYTNWSSWFFPFSTYKSFSTKNLNGLEIKTQIEFILSKKIIEIGIN